MNNKCYALKESWCQLNILVSDFQTIELFEMLVCSISFLLFDDFNYYNKTLYKNLII